VGLIAVVVVVVGIGVAAVGNGSDLMQITVAKFGRKKRKYSLIDRQCNFLELPKDGGVSQAPPKLQAGIDHLDFL